MELTSKIVANLLLIECCTCSLTAIYSPEEPHKVDENTEDNLFDVIIDDEPAAAISRSHLTSFNKCIACLS